MKLLYEVVGLIVVWAGAGGLIYLAGKRLCAWVQDRSINRAYRRWVREQKQMAILLEKYGEEPCDRP